MRLIVSEYKHPYSRVTPEYPYLCNDPFSGCRCLGCLCDTPAKRYRWTDEDGDLCESNLCDEHVKARLAEGISLEEVKSSQ